MLPVEPLNPQRRLPWLPDSTTPTPWLFQFFDGNVELSRVHHTLALELHPHPIGSRSRELQAELDLRAAISDKGVCVNQVDQVVARSQQVGPRADIFLDAMVGDSRK